MQIIWGLQSVFRVSSNPDFFPNPLHHYVYVSENLFVWNYSFLLQVHSMTDVLLCTASILNITLISVDRYFRITRAITYFKFRSEITVSVMICVVWILSALVSIPLLGHFPLKILTKSEITLIPEEAEILNRDLFKNTTQRLSQHICMVSTFE